MLKLGNIVEVKPECVETYKRLHREVWPDVLKILKNAHIEQYSIYLKQLDDGRYFLFSNIEYAGNDFKADEMKVAAEPATQEWWKLCKPCLKPLDGVSMEQCWAPMEQVFDLQTQVILSIL